MAKPVVATDIAGYASLVTHGEEGLLVPPKDAPQLAQALISLLRNETRRQQMGAKGRRKAEEHSWEGIARRVSDYYIRVLSETRRQQ